MILSGLAMATPALAEAWQVPQPQVDIPTVDLTEPEPCGNKMCVPWIGDYISGVYEYAIGIVGIVSALVIMFAGVLWITAGGNASRIDDAKAWMGAALTGLILAMGSYFILYQINPDLVQIQTIQIEKAEKIDNPEPFSHLDTIGTEISTTDEDGNQLSTQEIGDKCREECDGEDFDIQYAGPDKPYCVCESDVEENCNGYMVGGEPQCEDKCGSGSYTMGGLEGTGKFCCVCQSGQEGDSCGTANNCFGDLYCHNGTCHSGSEGSSCEDNSQCINMNCVTDLGVCSEDCSKCGDGTFNACDQTECQQLGCDFNDGWVTNSCD